MKRYTLEIVSNADELDAAQVKSKIEICTSKSVSLFKIVQFIQDENDGTILVETELPPEQMLELAKVLSLEMNGITIKIRYGWVVPSHVAGLVQIDEKEHAPFYEKHYPEYKTGRILYTPRNKFSLASLVLLILGIVFLYASFVANGKIPILGVVIFVGMVAYAGNNTLLDITCNKADIKFRYMTHSRAWRWTEISMLQIYQARGERVAVYSGDKKVDLPLAQLYDIKTKDELIRDIVARSKLFVGETSEKIIYRRSNYL